MAERRDPDIAAVLEEVQRQLHDLAAEFTAFKNVESKQLMDLKGAVGGTTQVFNVSYPPFVIPLVNVHESKNTNDKTINISGEALLNYDLEKPSVSAPWLLSAVHVQKMFLLRASGC